MILETKYHKWIIDNRILFKPSNKAPNQQQLQTVFEIANILDTTQTHKMTTCGRCYYNAKRVIENWIDKNL